MLFFGVPRVWEKMMAGLAARWPTQPETQAGQDAMAAGLAYVEAPGVRRHDDPRDQGRLRAGRRGVLRRSSAR